jgi:membrane-associated phospholipid phosphatase
MDRRLVIILMLLIVSGIALSLAADIYGVFQIDLRVALWITGENSPVFAAVMSAVSIPGDGLVPAVLVISAFAICAIRKKWIEAVFVVATLLSSSVISAALKVLVARPRPPSYTLNQSGLLGSFNQFAYPSGHVLFFVIFFGFVAFLSYRNFTGWIQGIAISSCAALIMLIGISRIYLGDHWLSDVIGSYIIGTFMLIILILLYQKVLSRRGG